MCSKQLPQLTVALVVLLLSFVACGKKGDPLPPLSTKPMATSDLSVRQQGRLIHFDMAYPTTTLGGLALDGVDAVELFVMTKPLPPGHKTTDPWPSAEPAEFQIAAKSLMRLSGGDLGAAVAGDRIQFQLPLESPLASPPVANIYAVSSRKGTEVSSLSNRVTLVASEPMASPSNLGAVGQEDGILVTWKSEATPAAFDVFRRDAQSRGYGGPIGRVEGKERQFLDRGARFGGRYIYTVRAVAVADPLVHSDEAGEREVTYEDRYPPAPPEELVLLAYRDAILVRWQASAAGDVQGYLLWRRDPGRDFFQINSQPLTVLEYQDRGLSTGLTFEYRVQAVDQAGNIGPFSRVFSATTR